MFSFEIEIRMFCEELTSIFPIRIPFYYSTQYEFKTFQKILLSGIFSKLYLKYKMKKKSMKKFHIDLWEQFANLEA
jgi:hypothetical protein